MNDISFKVLRSDLYAIYFCGVNYRQRRVVWLKDTDSISSIYIVFFIIISLFYLAQCHLIYKTKK